MKNPLVLIFAFAFVTTVILATGGNQLSNVQTGKASYYGREFEGRKTASGEIFRNSDFTCAHKKTFIWNYFKSYQSKKQIIRNC